MSIADKSHEPYKNHHETTKKDDIAETKNTTSQDTKMMGDPYQMHHLTDFISLYGSTVFCTHIRKTLEEIFHENEDIMKYFSSNIQTYRLCIHETMHPGFILVNKNPQPPNEGGKSTQNDDSLGTLYAYFNHASTKQAILAAIMKIIQQT